MRARRSVRLSLVSLVWLASTSAAATTINGAALGSDLAGGTVTVTRFGGAMNTATFVAVGTGAAAVAVGSAAFRLDVSAGDTSLATWTLTNTDPSIILFNRITAVTIDLTLSALSLFDSGSLPSTFDSGTGVAGVTYSAGALIAASGELNPWSDASNLGDMYTATSITFTVGLVAGGTSSWTDDTDIIPEPATGALVGLGLALFGARRRR